MFKYIWLAFEYCRRAKKNRGESKISISFLGSVFLSIEAAEMSSHWSAFSPWPLSVYTANGVVRMFPSFPYHCRYFFFAPAALALNAALKAKLRQCRQYKRRKEKTIRAERAREKKNENKPIYLSSFVCVAMRLPVSKYHWPSIVSPIP